MIVAVQQVGCGVLSIAPKFEESCGTLSYPESKAGWCVGVQLLPQAQIAHAKGVQQRVDQLQANNSTTKPAVVFAIFAEP